MKEFGENEYESVTYDNFENVTQLAKENRKFVYRAVMSGGRAKEFELAIMWLKDAGLIHKISRVSNASLPLGGFVDIGAFLYKYFIHQCSICSVSSLVPYYHYRMF